MKILRSRRIDPEVPLASMADIAFLLIIFFILAATFMQEPAVKLELPKDENIQKVETNPLYVSIDESAKIWVQGKETKQEAVESAVAGYIQRGDFNDPKKRLVLFKCDAKLPRSTFEPVIIAISDAGGSLVLLGEKGTPN